MKKYLTKFRIKKEIKKEEHKAKQGTISEIVLWVARPKANPIGLCGGARRSVHSSPK